MSDSYSRWICRIYEHGGTIRCELNEDLIAEDLLTLSRRLGL